MLLSIVGNFDLELKLIVHHFYYASHKLENVEFLFFFMLFKIAYTLLKEKLHFTFKNLIADISTSTLKSHMEF